ncbi:MAG TPA: hypothetical protein VJ063_06010 [Verrucomicrobiae bacterium]|nr:hypothetical protein [Verrucomicrobiae bacterium]
MLRVIGKGIYLKRDGSETPDLRQAVNFPDIAAAIDFCRHHGCKGLELLLLVQGAQALTIPMGEG